MVVAGKLGSRLKKSLRGKVTPLLFKLRCHRILLRKMEKRAAILMYHRLSPRADTEGGSVTGYGVDEARFEKQLMFLRENMNPLPLSDLADRLRGGRELPPRSVAVTFDDGYEDNFLLGYPLLKRYGVPATVFVTAGYIGTERAFWWDRLDGLLVHWKEEDHDLKSILASLSARFGIDHGNGLEGARSVKELGEEIVRTLKRRPPAFIEEYIGYLRESLKAGDDQQKVPRMLTWDQVREMGSNGIEIGSHTITHPNLNTLGPKEVRAEIMGSRETIESELGRKVRGFAIPFGHPEHYNRQVMMTLRDAGYLYACTVNPGYVAPGDDAFAMNRISMPDASVPESFWKVLKY